MTSETGAIQGRLVGLRVRAGDIGRAQAFFGAAFGWRFTRAGGFGRDQTASLPTSRLVKQPMFLSLTDDRAEPPARMVFAVSDPNAALASLKTMGGTGISPENATDNQGMPLGFITPPPHLIETEVTGWIGVIVVLVQDTAKAKRLHEQLFGRTFHQIGDDDRWWASDPPMGLFNAQLQDSYLRQRGDSQWPQLNFFVVVPNLSVAKARIKELGGEVIAEDAMGPYQVCDCRDDQGTRFCLWCDPSK